MSVSVSNKTIHPSSVTNKDLGASGLTVNDATFLVSEAVGLVGSPYGMSNKPVNAASVTNKTSS